MVAVVSAGVRRPVLLHVPRGGASRPLPLVVALHGAGQTGRDFAEGTGYSKLADRDHFLVAYPTAFGTRPFWNMNGHVAGKPDDVAYLRTALDRLQASACVDARRIYITGDSNGGGMTARAACELADRLAAAAPVAGGYSTLPVCRPTRPLPVLEIHGTGDQVVPYRGKGPQGAGSVAGWLGMWRRIDRCHGRARRGTAQPRVTVVAWNSCAPGTEVDHVRIEGEPHGWPGWSETRPSPPGPFSSTWTTWAFFRSHSR